MKRITICLLAALYMFGLLASCNSKSYDLRAVSGNNEKHGFEGGNLTAARHGLVCGGNDGYIYYRSANFMGLYKKQPDGLGKTKLSNHPAAYINVLDGWVYFIAGRQPYDTIYRVRPDGSEETALVEGLCNKLFVADSGLYFEMLINNDDSTDFSKRVSCNIYRADLSGENMVMVVSDSSLEYYYDGIIYFRQRNADSNEFRVFNTVNNEVNTLIISSSRGFSLSNLTVDSTGIYFLDFDEESKFCRINTDGSTDEVFLHFSTIEFGQTSFNYCNRNLYFIGPCETEGGRIRVLYQLDIDTNETTALYKFSNDSFDTQGGEITDTKEGFYETINQIYIIDGQVFGRGILREAAVQYGSPACLARLDNGVTILDWE